MKNTAIVGLVFIVFCISTICFASNFKVINIDADVMKRDSGNVWISLKATVANNGDNPHVAVMLQAVDRQNHTMKNFGLKGNIPPRATGELIGSIPVSEYEFKKIERWQVTE